jgi:septal ring factor EnvC (AmiA/AmiB activator)
MTPCTPGGRSVVATASLAALVVALVVASLAGAQTASKKAEDSLSAEQRKLQQTERQLREEKQKAADARARETSVLAELEVIERRLAGKQREIARLDTRIKRAAGDVQALRGEIQQLETQRAGQQAALGRRLRAMYKVHVQGGALPVLLSGEDPATRAAAVRHLTSLASLDARLIQEYRGTTDRLEDRRGREESRQKELAGLRADAQREQAEVDRDAAKRRGLLAKVRDERAYHERMVGELTEAARRLEAFIRDLQAKQRRVAKVPPPKPGTETPPAVGFGNLRGRLPWPTDGRVVSAFGAQVHPRFGTRTFRNGVDIEAGEGRDVGAVYAGHVVYTGWFKGYGNLIILDHDNEYYTLYAHVADILVKEGDDVKLGQRIGTVGDTGSLEGPRLYFEVRFQGKPQNPEQWLRQRG